jgi:hypothetical protein
LKELFFWTLSIVWCLKNKKIEELKIMGKISQYTRPQKITRVSITNHRATYLGAHSHKPLKQVNTPFDAGNFLHIFNSKLCVALCFLKMLLLISNISHGLNTALDI